MTQTFSQQAIMFADVSGSSALYKRQGNERAKAIIDQALDFMTALTIVNEGTVVKTLGDEVMTRFDHPDHACETAIAIQQRCLKEPELQGLALRIGIAYGPALLDRKDVFGETVNDAACVARIAQARQILLTQTALDQLDQGLLQLCQMFDRINIKGDTQQTLIYRLQWESPRQDHRATRLLPLQDIAQFVERFQLCLHLGKREITLLPDQTPYRIGRDPDKTHLHIDHDLVSREHCHIEFRRGKYVLVDHSTNGTYVCSTDQPHIYLRREEIPLTGKGEIGIGQPTAKAGPWLLRYQV